jgi:hypothetical protein
VLLVVLAGCAPRAAPTLTPREAAHYLEATCGVVLAAEPVVERSELIPSRSRARLPVRVSAVVVLPEEGIEPALGALRANRNLRRRGQTATRHSYESPPDALPVKECELDTALRVLFFRATWGRVR